LQAYSRKECGMFLKPVVVWLLSLECFHSIPGMLLGTLVHDVDRTTLPH
jgi:hypothetical protein